ncbi:hypothetical protein HRH25_09295 [Flavisolibacter sp. BT320]|nr:hypothetical protein [Flavisolibacter longurius]
MTLQDFQAFSSAKQRRLVHTKGVFLLTRTGVGLTAILCQVEGFYVELHLDADSAVVLDLHSFDDTAGLDPYLPQIRLTELQPLLRR